MTQVGQVSTLPGDDFYRDMIFPALYEEPTLGEQRQILAKLRHLAFQMKINSAQTSPKPSLTDLGHDENFIQVTTLEPNEVLRAIHDMDVRAMFHGNLYEYNIPSRDKSLSIYIKEYDQILLKERLFTRSFLNFNTYKKAVMTSCVISIVRAALLKNRVFTKRAVFYMNPALFKNQTNSDSVIEDVACLFRCTRRSLNIVACEKGLVIGNLTFSEGQQTFDCTKQGIGGKAIPRDLKYVTFQPTKALFVLLVEKEATYNDLASDKFYERYPCIIITGKGQPDVATRQFLRKIKTDLHLPILSIMDCDPHGFEIMTVYASGSSAMSYDNGNLTTLDVRWLGIRPSDVDRHNIPNAVRLQMTPQEITVLDRLLEEEFVTCKPQWFLELQKMRETQQKVEIQALNCFGMDYFSKIYLPRKLEAENWV